MNATSGAGVWGSQQFVHNGQPAGYKMCNIYISSLCYKWKCVINAFGEFFICLITFITVIFLPAVGTYLKGLCQIKFKTQFSAIFH